MIAIALRGNREHTACRMADRPDAGIDRDLARADDRAADLQDRAEAEKAEDQHGDERECPACVCGAEQSRRVFRVP